MNENLNLTKILKDCPKGWKFYSSVYGEVEFAKILSPRIEQEDELWFLSDNELSDYPIQFKALGSKYRVSNAGERIKGIGECIFFPSRDQRDWSKFTAPWYKSNTSIVKEEKFDPKTLKPFDKVLVRDSCNYMWECDLFSHVSSIISDYRYRCLASCYRYCIPCNDDTKHLLGTFNLPPEYYIYWDLYSMV